MRVPSKFATAALALLLAQPVISSNSGAQAEAVPVSSIVGHGEDAIELRRLHGQNRWRVYEEVVEVRAPRPDDDDDNDDDHDNHDDDDDNDDDNDNDDSDAADTKTTLSTSTISKTLATTASSTPNTWVMLQHVTGTTYTTVTCMTPTTVATSACSYINDKETTCAATSAVVPTCLPGMMCSFSQTDGAVSCVRRGGMPSSGFVVVAVLGLAGAVAATAIGLMCCQEHRAHKSIRQAAEARAALMAAAGAKKAPRVDVAEVGVVGGDHVPLMGAAMPVSGHAQEQRYGDADPFVDRDGYHGSSP